MGTKAQTEKVVEVSKKLVTSAVGMKLPRVFRALVTELRLALSELEQAQEEEAQEAESAQTLAPVEEPF